ncbi:MAG: hypothetical protein ACTSP4_03765 [Candidatus Hodarchaeales archaeon]
MNGIGTAFHAEFGSLIDSGNLYSTETFEYFSTKIDSIFGLETIQVLEEHYQFLELLKKAEEEALSEEETTEQVLTFFEGLKSNVCA